MPPSLKRKKTSPWRSRAPQQRIRPITGQEYSDPSISDVENGRNQSGQAQPVIYTGTSIAMTSLAMERDLAVPMRDGVRLFANLFRPTADGPHPVILSVTPYGKDKLPDRITTFFMRLSGVKFGKPNCSQLTGFESPDPIY